MGTTKNINQFSNTVGNALLKHKALIDSAYVNNKDLISACKEAFRLSNIESNSYTEEVITNLKRKKRDAQISYLYNIIMAGEGLKASN